MKKKLLLSSVAALTLFAAYSVATAEENTNLYGNFGERLDQPVKPLDAYSIEKVKTPEELQKEVDNFKERQKAAEELRQANAVLKSETESEANAQANLAKAQKAYEEALQKLKDATDTQYNAKEQLAKLREVKASVDAKLVSDQSDKATLTANDNRLLKAVKSAQAAANDAFEQAKIKLEERRNQKPVDKAPLEELKNYNLDLINLEAKVEEARDKKTATDKRVKEVEDRLAQLDKDIEANLAKQDSLAKAIKKLEKVVGPEKTESYTDKDGHTKVVNTVDGDEGEVRGVLIKVLKNDVDEKLDEVELAGKALVNATSSKKDAQKEYDSKLKAAQDVYKKQGVEFVLSDVLAVAESTDTFVTKFGWNKDEAGNWVYLLNSEGKKATGWVNENGSWYYFNKDGVMQKWWVQVEGTWYYLNGSGAMQTGWLQDNGTWYYLEASGAMKANQWFEVDGKWYHVNESGALSVNTTVDGYNVNENGEWV